MISEEIKSQIWAERSHVKEHTRTAIQFLFEGDKSKYRTYMLRAQMAIFELKEKCDDALL